MKWLTNWYGVYSTQLHFGAPGPIFKVQGALDCLSKWQIHIKSTNCVWALVLYFGQNSRNALDQSRWCQFSPISALCHRQTYNREPRPHSMTTWWYHSSFLCCRVQHYNTWMLPFIWQTWSYVWSYSTYGTTREWALPLINGNHDVIQKKVLVHRENDIFVFWYWVSVQKVKTNFVTLKV